MVAAAPADVLRTRRISLWPDVEVYEPGELGCFVKVAYVRSDRREFGVKLEWSVGPGVTPFHLRDYCRKTSVTFFLSVNYTWHE